MNITKRKNLKAFSLLELIVSMGIVGVVIAMLSNVLVNSIIVSQKSIARSFIREEITDIGDRISNDVRDATNVISCDGSLDTASCVIETDGGTYSWQICVNSATSQKQICKKDSAGNQIFVSSPNLTINQFTFEQGFDTGGNTVKKNIILTLVGSHANTAFNVNNVLRQVSISTRNYVLTAPGGIIKVTP